MTDYTVLQVKSHYKVDNLLEQVQRGVDLEGLRDGRRTRVADLVALEAEGVQRGAELLQRHYTALLIRSHHKVWHLPQQVQRAVDLQSVRDGRRAGVADVVRPQTEGVQRAAELL